jgi:NAD(P)-dependent dehydrogenase (short-subunit alcohol dehydrogenase family)
MRLKNKIALVTGSTTGIGEAIARRFAQEGATVMVHGLDQAGAERVVAAIQEEDRGQAAFHIADLADPETSPALIGKTIAAFGGLDILVNNAALIVRSTLETTDADLFDRVMAVNVRAPLLLTQAALPHFRRAGGGAVLNIGSINGYCGEYNQLAYAISKGGLMTLSRNLADAHGHEGIRVNHFNLGWILTANEKALKIREGLPEDWPQKLPSTFAPSGRLLAPEEIAQYALAFVAPDGGPVNGAVVDLEQYPMIGRNPRKTTA